MPLVCASPPRPAELLHTHRRDGSCACAGALAEQVNQATLADHQRQEQADAKGGPDPFIVKAQVLLSRRSISPGVIDGIDGENFRKAVAQFRRQAQLPDGDAIDEAAWQALGGDKFADAIGTYVLTEKDAAYDFAEEIPTDYAKQARMKRLSYTSPEEMLGERFHMSEALLAALNRKQAMREAGARVHVASVRRSPEKGSAQWIDAVKSTGMVLVYGAGNELLASYPATIGSEDTPSPSGEHSIERIARNPGYTYDPDKNFQQGRTKRDSNSRPDPTARSERSGSRCPSRPSASMARPNPRRSARPAPTAASG